MASGKMFESVKQPLPIGRRGVRAEKGGPALSKKKTIFAELETRV